jgi:hypothetical protein
MLLLSGLFQSKGAAAYNYTANLDVHAIRADSERARVVTSLHHLDFYYRVNFPRRRAPWMMKSVGAEILDC